MSQDENNRASCDGCDPYLFLNAEKSDRQIEKLIESRRIDFHSDWIEYLEEFYS